MCRLEKQSNIWLHVVFGCARINEKKVNVVEEL